MKTRSIISGIILFILFSISITLASHPTIPIAFTTEFAEYTTLLIYRTKYDSYRPSKIYIRYNTTPSTVVSVGEGSNIPVGGGYGGLFACSQGYVQIEQGDEVYIKLVYKVSLKSGGWSILGGSNHYHNEGNDPITEGGGVWPTAPIGSHEMCTSSFTPSGQGYGPGEIMYVRVETWQKIGTGSWTHENSDDPATAYFYIVNNP